MRRMITESDVEKLDSIKPSEMQKLAAMQDPKEARANQVLTADGTGKAVYKDASGKTYNLSIANMGIEDLQLAFYTPDTPLPENEFGYNQLAAIIWRTNPINLSILTMTGSNGVTIHGNLSANDGIIITYSADRVVVYISEEIQQQLNISAGDSIMCKAIISIAQLF